MQSTCLIGGSYILAKNWRVWNKCEDPVCRVSVDAGVTTDIAGNPNTAASLAFEYRPVPYTYETAAYVANGVVGGLLGFAVAAPIAATALGSSGVLLFGQSSHKTFTNIPESALGDVGILLHGSSLLSKQKVYLKYLVLLMIAATMGWHSRCTH